MKWKTIRSVLRHRATSYEGREAPRAHEYARVERDPQKLDRPLGDNPAADTELFGKQREFGYRLVAELSDSPQAVRSISKNHAWHRPAIGRAAIEAGGQAETPLSAQSRQDHNENLT